VKEYDPRAKAWAEALSLLDEAEQLHRQFFHLGSPHVQRPTWEPPVDMFDTDDELLILVALPGVNPAQVEIFIDGAVIAVRGVRRMPETFQYATARRLEIPYGYFERRIELPNDGFEVRERTLVNGCLTLTLSRIDHS